MKKLALILLSFISFTYCNQPEILNTIYGGLAIAIGTDVDGKLILETGMRPGITFSMEPIKKFVKFFGLGGHLDYSWLTLKRPSNLSSSVDLRGGIHFWDLALVPKFYIPFNDISNIAFECDPGLSLAYAYLHLDKFRNSAFKAGFGLTSGITFNYKSIACAFRFKSSFLREIDGINWITFSVGYVFR